MREIIFQAFVYVLQAIILIICGYIIMFIKSKIGKEKYNLVLKFAMEAVKAAEQIYSNVKGAGVDKKKLAVNFLVTKFKLTGQEAEMLVEAAVRELKALELEATKQQ